MTTEYKPYFLDSNGSEVHIGDMVSWPTTNGATVRTKSGSVQEITYKVIESAIGCMVKVKGRTQGIAASCLTLIDNDTLSGKLRHLVAASDGRICEEDIETTAAEIEALFADDEQQEEQQEEPVDNEG